MKVKNKEPIFKRTVVLLLLMLCFCLLFFLFRAYIIINVTSSMPKGIYYNTHQTTPSHSDVIAICLPNGLWQFALQRGYLLKGIHCQGVTPLIKRVIAIPGDQVQITNKSITVNGRAFIVKKYRLDSQGYPLSPYPNGHYDAKGYWVLGTSNPRSWDSRYFGEVSPNSILSILKPVIIW